MEEYSDKVHSSLLLGSYLDTLGFRNGKWEFNFNFGKINNINLAIIIWSHISHH